MKNKRQLIIHLLLLSALTVCAQSFEGTITLKSSAAPDRIPVMTIREDRSVLEVKLDSIETIKLIKDRGAGTMTILRARRNMKYGFRTVNVVEETLPELSTIPNAAKVDMVQTGQVKNIGPYQCKQWQLKSATAMAEAWITTDPGIKLSTYFPQYFGGEADPELGVLRLMADHEGMILFYHETLIRTKEETLMEIFVEEKEISMDAFHIDGAYLVLDEEGMKQLYQQAQTDPAKMKQWEEFNQVFSNK